MGAQAAKSARRAFEIFELLSEDAGMLAVSEVARALDYPASSTSVLLRELCGLGYLVQDKVTRRYGPAPRIAMASVRLTRDCQYEQRIASLVDSINVLTGEEVIVAVQRGVEVQYVHLRKATLPFVSRHRTGALRPICRTSMGKMLLAEKREDEIGRLVRRVNADGGARPIALPHLLDEVRAARDRHFAAAYEEATPGAAGLAALLPSRAGQPSMVLAVCGLAERIRQRRHDLTEVLRRATEAAGSGQTVL